MKNRLRLSWGLILLALISCSTSERKTGDTKTIVLKKTKDIQPVSSFISGVDYIELQYPEKIKPGRIEYLKILNKEIIVEQRFSGETSILRFSGNGEFINRIGKNKVQEPRDIINYNKNFAIWDDAGIKVFSKKGIFQRKIFNVRKPGSRFFYSKGKFYLFHETNAPGYLSEYSTDGKKKHIFHPIKERFESMGNPLVTELAKGNFCLFSPINDTIYSFSDRQLTPKYIFDGMEYPTYIEVLEKISSKSPSKKREYINNNQHWIVTRYLENKNFIFIDYTLGSYPFNMIIRKSDWQVSYIKEFINDVDGGVWDDPLFLSQNDELYIPLTSYQISGHTIKNKKRHGFNEQMEKAQQTNNPVLMVCKLK